MKNLKIFKSVFHKFYLAIVEYLDLYYSSQLVQENFDGFLKSVIRTWDADLRGIFRTRRTSTMELFQLREIANEGSLSCLVSKKRDCLDLFSLAECDCVFVIKSYFEDTNNTSCAYTDISNFKHRVEKKFSTKPLIRESNLI